MEILGVAHGNYVEVGSVDFDEGKVGGGVGADNGSVIVAVVVKGHFKPLRVGNDVVVGHDIAVGRYNHARAESDLSLFRLSRLLLLAWLLARSAEEIFKEWVVEESASVAHILLLTGSGVAFHRYNAVDSAFGSVDKSLLIGGRRHGALS